MALKCGIVGLPNVGKSTLFNCVSSGKAQSANFPFCTIEPNIGSTNVPDKRLEVLESLCNPKRVIPATVEIVDIAGLVKGASKGEGLGNQFLANIRETDAILHVLRCFEDPNIVHVDGSVDPVRDKEIIDTELQLKDLETVENRITSEIIDINPTPASHFEFDFSMERARKLIGKELSEETFLSILASLDVEIRGREGEVLHVAVPPYRVDVQREADLIEDVLRVYGYNNIEVSDHVNSTLSYAPKPDKSRMVNIASDFLTSNGYTEIMSNSLSKVSYYEGSETYPAERCVKIMNPLSQDLNVMRQTLLFNALEAVELNVNRRNANLRMYECGNCYAYNVEKADDENTLAKYEETYRLGIAITGLASQLSWNSKAEGASFFSLRGIVERLLKRFGIDIYALQSEALQSELYADAVILRQGPKEVLRMGVVAPSLRKKFDIKQDVFFAEIDFDQLIKMTKKAKIQFKELSKFPEVKRDLALLVDKSVTFAQLRGIAFATEKKLLKSVSLFDVYEGDKLPEGKKSYALSFILEDKNQTLTDKQIERTMANLQTQLEQKAGAEVRK